MFRRVHENQPSNSRPGLSEKNRRSRGSLANRKIAIGAIAALALVGSGCSASDTDEQHHSDPNKSQTAYTSQPSPTPTVFKQKYLGDADGEAAIVEVNTAKQKRKFRASNVGISFEATDLADQRLDPAKSNLDDLLSSLGSPALRFGGNGLDRRTFWTSTGEKAEESQQTVVTPGDLRRLKKLVDDTGSKVTIGIPLGNYDPKRGADMAAHAVEILDDSLVGLAIGNEPNGYTVKDVPDGAVRDKGWTKDKYVQQLEAYAKVIHEKEPDAPIIGPDVYDGAWMDAFAGSNVKNKAAISQHWYQLYECDSGKIPGRGPQAENLINPLAKEAAKKNLSIGKAKADAADLPLWLEETGPTSCPGTNDTSLTNASALWAVDYSLNAARLGVERMAMHSMLGACRGGAPMSPICDPADKGERSRSFAVRPNMLGMRLLVPSIGGAFTKTAVEGGGNMSAYTVSKNDGTTLVTTVINANDAPDVGRNPTTLKMPDGFAVDKVSQIHGPSNNAKRSTRVIPANPLPQEVPFKGTNREIKTSSGPNGDELNIDLAGSSATVFIMSKS